MANRGVSWDTLIHSIQDLKDHGSRRLPKMYRDYFNEGAMDLLTVKENEEAYDYYKIQPRVLVNVDNVNISGEIFGFKTALPLGFSPAAMHGLAHPDGEIATSRAAAKMGISAGYKAILLSADTPCLGRRLNEYRNNFSLPDGMSWPNLLSDGKSELRASRDQIGKSDEVPAEPSKHDYGPSVNWDSLIPWLRQHTKLQIWVKGIYGPDDVRVAIKHGLDGVCAPVARGKIPITVDGGIRRGTDIFKALALGASHCFVGRIPIWGLAYDGQEGVELALKILMYEFKVAMLLAGCKSVKDITQDHFVYKKADGILAKL
ncbi:Oxidase FUB9 [Colletotrichum aenigma]|uniref:Oxidase FUB9 n=1 Tax=Colletotrichum aenigma TaxID=1215731 RepID=UPI00187319EF|nr:Oxidase FUB9 [Colletotrichum aenigma]KAF5502404.1 Oxidase FUB9 [Colletotrichum aenigma]